MSALSRVLVLIGVLSLLHAAYSAHEFSTLTTKLHIKPDLPLDIKLETITSICLACFGLVWGANTFKPISWSVWAGQIERDGGAMNPFRSLEDRPGFMDIRAKRREFTEWVKEGGQQAGSKN